MVSNNDFDTSYAKTVSQMMATSLSTYSSAGHAILENINIIPYVYGKEHITRPVANPYDDVIIDRRFNAPEQQAEKLVQEIDFACVSKRIMIDSVDYAGDPANAQKVVSDGLSIVKDGLEKFFIEGTSTRIVNYGLHDNTITGIINRPDVAGLVTSALKWDTITGMQDEVGDCLGQLIADKFNGPYLMMAPTICIPLFAQVMTSTAVPVSTWVSQALGLPVIFSPFVDSDALVTAFDVYIIDTSKVHMGMTDLKIDQYYDNKGHAYFWDFEVFTSALFDPLNNGTEIVKGVGLISQVDWNT